MNISYERVKTIDGLRFVAILPVLIFHIWNKRLTGGFIGVDIFFVISGYVVLNSILRNYQATNTFSAVSFLLARARRILLPLALLIVLISGYTHFVHDRVYAGIIRQSLMSSVFFVPNWNEIIEQGNYFFAGWVKPTEHFWSLGVEEQFYFFVTALSFFALRKYGKVYWLRNAFAALFGVSIALFLYKYATFAYTQRIYMGTDTRAFQIALGALLVFAPKRKITKWVNQITSLLSFSVLMLLFFVVNGTNSSYFTWGIFVVSFVTAFLIYLFTNEDKQHPSLLSRFLQTRAVQIIGLTSYEIYLWHVFVMTLLNQERSASLGLHDPEVVRLVQFGVSIVLGILTHYFFSKKLSEVLSTVKKERQAGVFAALVAGVFLFVVLSTGQWERRPDYAAPYHQNSPDGYAEYWLTLGNSVQRGIFPVFRTYLEANGVGAIGLPAYLSCASFIESSLEPKVYSSYHCARSLKPFFEETFARYNVSNVVLFKTYRNDDYVKIEGEWIAPGSSNYLAAKTREITELGRYFEQKGVDFTVVYVDAPGTLEFVNRDPTQFVNYVEATAPFTTKTVLLNGLPCESVERGNKIYCNVPFDVSYRDNMHLDEGSKRLLSEYLYHLVRTQSGALERVAP